MAPPAKLTVRCQIVGHASPQWKGARTEAERVKNNDVLAQQRGEAFMREFKPALEKALGKYLLNFSTTSYAKGDEHEPDRYAVIDSYGRGQDDSLRLAGGDKTNNASTYRRADVVVEIARTISEQVRTRVVQPYQRSTKSKFWWASVGVGGSVTVGAGLGLFRIKLENTKGDEASGAVVTFSGGFGAKYSFSTPYSWTEAVSFMTDREVGFEDFHGRTVRYTSANFVPLFGYSRAYLTFYGMGPEAASLFVGGWTTGLQLGADLAEGLLLLDTVPSNYKIEQLETTEWRENHAGWMTRQETSIYFDSGESKLTPAAIREIQAFALKVAEDIRTQP
jgi:hypothetical protein